MSFLKINKTEIEKNKDRIIVVGFLIIVAIISISFVSTVIESRNHTKDNNISITQKKGE